MKTPRDLLLIRHRQMNSKLDAVRVHVVAGLGGEKINLLQAELRLLDRIWQELIQPARRLWLGVAAAWCVIAVLHSTAPSTGPLLKADFPRPSLEMIMVFQYPDVSAVAELKPISKQEPPGPRSDRYANEAKS